MKITESHCAGCNKAPLKKQGPIFLCRLRESGARAYIELFTFYHFKSAGGWRPILIVPVNICSRI